MAELAASPVAKKTLAEADEGIGAWLSGLITGKGDSPSHAIVTAVLGVVPGLGQIMDARDAILDIVTLTQTPEDTGAWVGLTITLIGFIPVFGDGIKCTFKLARSGHAFPRLLDLLPNKYRGNIVRWIKEMDFASIAAQVKGIGTKILTGFSEALDSWVMRRVVLDSKTVKRYLEQLEGLRKRLNSKIDAAMNELKAMRDRMLRDAEPPSTHRPDAASPLPPSSTTAPPKTATPPASTAPKTATPPTTHPTAGTAAPPIGGGVPGAPPKGGKGKPPPRGGAGAGHPPNQPPVPPPPPVPLPGRGPASIPKGQPGTHARPGTTTQTSPNANQRRRNSGVLGEHLTDYYMKYEHYNYKKINDDGNLVGHNAAPKGNGIDHIWFMGNPASPQPYLVGDTKSTITEKVLLVSLMSKEMAEKIKGLGDDPKNYKNVKLETPADDEAKNLEQKVRNKMGKTDNDGRQMSHQWIVAKVASAKVVMAYRADLMSRIKNFEQDMATMNEADKLSLIAPYLRTIYFVNQKQMDMHNDNQSLHTTNPRAVHKISWALELMNNCLWR
jgi:hypothetical protein